jgi:hypothetical protein
MAQHIKSLALLLETTFFLRADWAKDVLDEAHAMGTQPRKSVQAA